MPGKFEYVRTPRLYQVLGVDGVGIPFEAQVDADEFEITEGTHVFYQETDGRSYETREPKRLQVASFTGVDSVVLLADETPVEGAE